MLGEVHFGNDEKAFTEWFVKPWNRLCVETRESPCLEVQYMKAAWMSHLGTWFTGALGRVRLMVGLDDLCGYFQPKRFRDSMIQKHSALGSDLGFCACCPLNLGSTLDILRQQGLCSPSPEPPANSDQASMQLIQMRKLIFQKNGLSWAVVLLDEAVK